jgi:hypothetical protein
MIEVIIAKALKELQLKSFPVVADKDTPTPYVLYALSGLSTHKDLSEDKWRTAELQFNIFADQNKYATAKDIQYKLLERFDDIEEVIQLKDKTYSLIYSLNNSLDLFNTELKQVVIDLSIEYLVTNNNNNKG